MRKFALLSMLAIVALLGCTSTQTTGRRTGEVAQPIKKIYVVAQDPLRASQATPRISSVTQASVELVYREALTVIESRLPVVFALNDIDAKVLVNRGQTPKVDPREASFVLTLSLTGGTVHSNGGRSFDVGASIRDISTGKTIWVGAAKFTKPSVISISDKSGEEFAQSLLQQMAKDGVISLPGKEVRMPSK
ncbi:MAG: hypothetical protein AAB403_01650 [Planctomycetota bacterium]